jgi:hypothetical protein
MPQTVRDMGGESEKGERRRKNQKARDCEKDRDQQIQQRDGSLEKKLK